MQTFLTKTSFKKVVLLDYLLEKTIGVQWKNLEIYLMLRRSQSYTI